MTKKPTVAPRKPISNLSLCELRLGLLPGYRLCCSSSGIVSALEISIIKHPHGRGLLAYQFGNNGVQFRDALLHYGELRSYKMCSRSAIWDELQSVTREIYTALCLLHILQTYSKSVLVSVSSLAAFKPSIRTRSSHVCATLRSSCSSVRVLR